MADYSSVAGLVVNLFSGAYLNRRVLLTGHTGFKGSWLALWLTKLGAHVTGASLAPATTPNHWDLLKLDVIDHRIDIRDPDAVARVVEETQPEIVFHLAAQALVRRSYTAPVETWATNVMGTCHVLEACDRFFDTEVNTIEFFVSLRPEANTEKIVASWRRMASEVSHPPKFVSRLTQEPARFKSALRAVCTRLLRSPVSSSR